jgi:hypothetical protein
VTWPAGKSGYTIVLQSIPVGEGEHAAAAFARRAARAGLPKVGYLNSSDFSSLHPGYWVVFSGIYNSIAASRSNASNASSNGFEGAYPRRITP